MLLAGDYANIDQGNDHKKVCDIDRNLTPLYARLAHNRYYP